MFLEIGWFSQANVAYEPWDYTQDELEPIDLELQRSCTKASSRAGRAIRSWADSASGNGRPATAGPKIEAIRPKTSRPKKCCESGWPSRGGK